MRDDDVEIGSMEIGGVVAGGVVVIGGGLAGLTAALAAARQGAEVAVLEARSSPGGRARSEQRAGFALNEGPHALYADGEARSTLHSLGIATPGWVPDQRGARGLVECRLALLPIDPVSLTRTSLLGVRGKVAAGRLLRALPGLDPADLTGQTVENWLRDAAPGPGVRRLVQAVVRLATYCDAPEHLDAAAAVTQVQRSLAGSVRYLEGGWQHLVDQLRRAVVDEGGVVRTGTKVARVRPTLAGSVAVELADGPSIAAGAVVLAAGGPGHAAALLGSAGATLDEVAARAVPATVSALDVALSEPWGPGPSFVLGIDEPLYLSVHSPTGAHAPADRSLVSVAQYHRPGAVGDPERTRVRLEAMLDLVRPGWRRCVVDERFLRHAVVAHDVPGARSGGRAGRPSVHGASVTGVHLAGDWVGPAGLLADATVASAAHAGREAATHATRCRVAT